MKIDERFGKKKKKNVLRKLGNWVKTLMGFTVQWVPKTDSNQRERAGGMEPAGSPQSQLPSPPTRRALIHK